MSQNRRDISGMHFIRVRGTAQERARQHAQLLRAEIEEGALKLLSKKNQWMIRRGPGLIRLKPVQNSAVWFYDNILLPWLARRTPAEELAVMDELARETGLPFRMFRSSLFQADGLMLLSRISTMKHLLKHLPNGGLPGCTSAVVTGQWTEGGRTYHARNMDYPVVGPWEAHPVVMFSEPSESGQIPSVAVTTAGVHTSGLTAMNREGITVCAHAHFGREVSLSGLPIFAVGERIVREARTLGQAVDIARKHKRSANWALVVSSAKDRDGAVIEMTPERTEVHPTSGGAVIHSNFFHTPELQATEALLSGGICDDLVGRICRTRQVLEPNKGSVTPSHLAAALGDHVDYRTGVERVFGNTVSVVTTIKSVVFSPEEQKFWVAARNETPVSLGEYLEVDVEKFWDRPESEPVPRLPGNGARLSRELKEGIKHYRSAYQHWHIFNDAPDYAEKTLVELQKALAAYPADGNVWIQTGLVAFRLKKFEEARRCFETALEMPLVAEVERVRDLFLARCKDLAGDRAGALELYRAHVACGDPKIRKAFVKGA
ncbi:MAG TPA: C45 family autoproteolytic acyltransferase/hydrolase, partial [Bdellovibrionota bacterium]|nr:C45 family autoproteolytic acyltransferase/hydrolase [Bdellovibrionota bacterium]